MNLHAGVFVTKDFRPGRADDHGGLRALHPGFRRAAGGAESDAGGRQFQRHLIPRAIARLSGAHFSELPERYRQQGVRGVVISKIAKGGRAEKNNLAAGDLVLGINREGVEDMNAFRAKVATTPQRLVLVLQRGGQRGELEMR